MQLPAGRGRGEVIVQHKKNGNEWFNMPSEWDLPRAILPLNQWTHLVFTREGNTGRLYIDGVLAYNSDMFDGHIPSALNNQSAFPDEIININSAVGANTISQGNFDDPVIESKYKSMQVWDRTLSAAEISVIYSYGRENRFSGDNNKPDTTSLKNILLNSKTNVNVDLASNIFIEMYSNGEGYVKDKFNKLYTIASYSLISTNNIMQVNGNMNVLGDIYQNGILVSGGGDSLDVEGDINFNGTLYRNGRVFIPTPNESDDSKVITVNSDGNYVLDNVVPNPTEGDANKVITVNSDGNYVLDNVVPNPTEGDANKVITVNSDGNYVLDNVVPNPTEGDANKVITVNSDGNYTLGPAGVNYDSNLSDGVLSEAVGGIASGTDISTLKGMSIISILDTILFPINNPTITNSGSVLINNNFSHNGVVEVGTVQNNNQSITINKGSYSLPTNSSLTYLGAVSSVIFKFTTGASYNVATSESIAQIIDEITFNNETTSITSGSGDNQYDQLVYSAPPFNSGTGKYTHAYNTIKLLCSVTFGAGPTPNNSHGNPYTHTNMPSLSQTKTDTNIRYSVYKFYQGTDTGGEKKIIICHQLTYQQIHILHIIYCFYI